MPSHLGKCLQQHRATSGGQSRGHLEEHQTSILQKAQEGLTHRCSALMSLHSLLPTPAAEPGQSRHKVAHCRHSQVGTQLQDFGHFSKLRLPPPVSEAKPAEYMPCWDQSPPDLLAPRPQSHGALVPSTKAPHQAAFKHNKQSPEILNGEEYLWPV